MNIIYTHYISKKSNLIIIDDHMHGNILFNKIINSNTNLNHFCNNINNKYFNYIQSYRGDYYMNCITSNRGKNLISKLNINIAVSNYQGI